jgi:hypothetical protein
MKPSGPQPISFNMPRPNHYSPTISRFVVSILYHEAQHRRIPMTQLTDELLQKALHGTHGWHTATHLEIAGTPAPHTTAPMTAQAI